MFPSKPRFKAGASRRRNRHKPGVMNKTEAKYSFILEHRRQKREIIDWQFETMGLKLASNTFFYPDFIVFDRNGSMLFVDVKARTKDGKVLSEDDARAKIKVAAELFPFFVFVVASIGKDGIAHEEVIASPFTDEIGRPPSMVFAIDHEQVRADVAGVSNG